MKSAVAWTLHDLAAAIGAELRGNGAIEVDHIAPLNQAGATALSFLTSAKYRDHLAQTQAAAVILKPVDAEHYAGSALLMDDPYLGYARAAQTLFPDALVEPGIHPSAVVDATAKIDPSACIAANAVIGAGAEVGAGVYIGPLSYVGDACIVGEASRLVARVTLLGRSVVGRACLLHAGCVIGDDGFGFARDSTTWVKIPQLGRVVLGDRVEVGNNTTIDRGALGDTVIEDGVKLDNLIQIAHNVHIGANSAFAAQVGIAGSTSFGARCTVAGQAGVAGHLQIADDVHFTGQAMVTKSVGEAGVYSSGLPAEANRKWRRTVARVHGLEQLQARVEALEAALAKQSATEKSA
jgi:UDP-3-O-[3-hydroxymyristoyl] glucosamine N-acyltransferase